MLYIQEEPAEEMSVCDGNSSLNPPLVAMYLSHTCDFSLFVSLNMR